MYTYKLVNENLPECDIRPSWSYRKLGSSTRKRRPRRRRRRGMNISQGVWGNSVGRNMSPPLMH